MIEQLSVQNLNIVADMKSGKKSIVSNLQFSLCTGERLAIVGESGCGKTMTAMAILGLLPENCHADGKVLLLGVELLRLREKEIAKLRGTKIVLMPQSGADFLNPSLKIKTQMFESLAISGVKGRKKKHELACQKLELVGLQNASEILESYPFQLSGGMAQRVILAIGTCAMPDLVICDEPTRGIDDETANLFLDKLDGLFPNAAIIVITHNMEVASRCGKLLVMFNGQLVESGDTNKVLANPKHPYTKNLISALPQNGFVLDMQEKNANKSMCRYAEKCKMYSEECDKLSDELKESDGTKWRCIHG